MTRRTRDAAFTSALQVDIVFVRYSQNVVAVIRFDCLDLMALGIFEGYLESGTSQSSSSTG